MGKDSDNINKHEQLTTNRQLPELLPIDEVNKFCNPWKKLQLTQKGMARRKTRVCRTRSWFLLKDSVIFVLVLCMLHIIQVQIVLAAAKFSTDVSVIKAKPMPLVDPAETIRSSQVAAETATTTSATVKGEKVIVMPSNSSKINSSKSSSNHSGSSSDSSNSSASDSNKSDNSLSTSSVMNAIIQKTLSDVNVIRENVMLPSSDPEREAQILYEKTLKEYHHGSKKATEAADKSRTTNTRGDSENDSNDDVVGDGDGGGGASTERTLHKVCEMWVALHCHCTGHLDRLSLGCRRIGATVVPPDLPIDVVLLDFGNNNLTTLRANSFVMVSNLEELILSDNSLINIDPNAFNGLSKLKRLSLQNCGLKVIPSSSFQGLLSLISLQLNGNALASMESDSLKHLQKLRTLRLESNLFYRIPTNALAGLRSLEALNLGSNLLTIINDDDFPKMPNLIVLLLKRNQIMKISSGAFTNLTALKVLDLDDNLISSLPDGLNQLTHLQEFSVSGNRLRCINDTDLPKNLQTIDFRANPLQIIVRGALQGMSRLRKLILSDVRALKAFPDLDGSYSLEFLKLDRAGLIDIPINICRQAPRLKSLELQTNSLQRVPVLANCRELRLLDLSNNYIDSLSGRPFLGLKQLHDLLLSYNRISSISQDTFMGIPRLQLLDLEGNGIGAIHKDAFVHFNQLEDLNLGNNFFPILPSTGLHRLLHLKTFNNPKLKDFPPPDTFPRIQTLVLSYAYHCCPFLPLVAMTATRKPPFVQEAVLFPSDSEFDMSLWNNSMMDIWPQLHNLSKKFGSQMTDLWDNFGQDFNYPGNLPAYVEEYFEEDASGGAGAGAVTVSSNTNNIGLLGGGSYFRPMSSDITPGSVQCLPLPGPFLPCVDLFDWWTLRCGVWVVFLLAMLGNGTVVFVLIFSRSKMDVPRFLVCNLAAADFFMGIYLGILAIVDASTLGEFRMFAIPWQMSIVCQIAGFLAVLSSELSVYTLAVITLERNYAITHAIHLNKRLSLKQAGYIMIVGWIFSLIMATLPLIGVSDYRKFAVCLPFETTNSVASLSYVIGLMFINGCAFLTLMGCYLKMYWAIRGSQAWNTNDSRIAKRMALLVFTDFLCWSPIAFFSMTAIFGLQLVSLEQAKIFTVFILPLNSCCNPFLYAIMTKQFKKDCVTLCKTFEETRVTRTVGRCERTPKELPPLLPTAAHPPGCRCLRMMPSEMPMWHRRQEKEGTTLTRAWNRIMAAACCCKQHNKPHKTENHHRRSRNRTTNATDPYTYQFSEIKSKRQTRASSISSENFCSSRSSSWRNGPIAAHHTCTIPLKMIEPNRRRHSAWLITRKTSQDSNLSSSRNDSSASATTASTSTFRLSRSSAGSTTPLPSIIAHSSKSNSTSKPRLVRQEAVQEEEDSSPPRLGVRFLPTIPSAADSSVIMEDGDSLSPQSPVNNATNNNSTSTFYTVLQQTGNTKATLSSPKCPANDCPS